MASGSIRIFKRIVFAIIALPAVIVLLLASQHLRAPWYKFPAAKPFAGSRFYNPYEKMDSRHWLKANFHMHSHAWGGFTNGSQTEDSSLWKVYTGLGFKSLSISNYQNINTLYSDSTYYIPAYEHGYGIFKNHQLCLGAKKVDWFDMPLRQTIHQKQYMINRLRSTSQLVSINHPKFFGGYTPGDFTKLSGYDFIEVLNGYRNSEAHWDSALSAGRPAMLLADDDMHDLHNPREPARRFILVNAPTNNRNDIFSALKAGNSIGVYHILPHNESWESKKAWLDSMPEVDTITLAHDTLRIKLNRKALEFRFIGQGGKLLAKAAFADEAWYAMQQNDTYVRTVILFSTPSDREGLQYFLNPVFRTSDGQKPAMPAVQSDFRRTLSYRFVMLATAAFVVMNIIALRKRFRPKKPLT